MPSANYSAPGGNNTNPRSISAGAGERRCNRNVSKPFLPNEAPIILERSHYSTSVALAIGEIPFGSVS